MFGELISAGANLINGFMNRSAQEEYNAQQLALGRENMQMQKDFAQQGIRWKVDDARAAGLHPLVALGAQTNSFSPVSVGGEAPQMDLGSMGQDISRAMSSMKEQDEKTQEVASKAAQLSLEKGALENDLLRSQIRRLNSPGTGPGMPSQGNGKVTTLIDGQPATQVTTPAGASVSSDKIQQKADTAPAAARIRAGGVKLYTNPYMSDAQDIEDRYGNIAEEVAGAANLVGDMGYSAYRHWPAVRSYLRDQWRDTRRKSDRAWRPRFENNGMPQP